MSSTPAPPRERMLVANIGLAERRKRHRAGFAALLLAALTALVAWAMGLPLAVRAASGAFFFVGFIGIFQARVSTCVALASRGARDMDEGPEEIVDPAEVAAVRAQARSVMAKSLIATVSPFFARVPP